jgi:creatinine amidohydrolase
MALSPASLMPERQPFSDTEQAINYHRLLLHILAEAESFGFEVGVLVAGHYPLIDHTRAAVLQFNQRHGNRSRRDDPLPRLLAWTFADYLLLKDEYENAGDHAAGWETSHMLSSHPQSVDLDSLPPKGEELIGVAGRMAPQDATAIFGREVFAAAAEIAVREVQHRLEHKHLYLAHGKSLQEGLWRSPEN